MTETSVNALYTIPGSVWENNMQTDVHIESENRSNVNGTRGDETPPCALSEMFLKAAKKLFADFKRKENQSEENYPQVNIDQNGSSDSVRRQLREECKRKKRVKIGQYFKKRKAPVAFVLCDGQVFEIVSPDEQLTELRKTDTEVVHGTTPKHPSDDEISTLEPDGDTDGDTNCEPYECETKSDKNDPDFKPDITEDGSDNELEISQNYPGKSKGQGRYPEPEAMTFESVDESGTRVYRCNVCERHIKSKWRAHKHSMAHKRRFCTLCQKELSSVQSFQGHMKNRHSGLTKRRKVRVAQSARGSYKCTVCGKIYRYFSVFKNHFMKHSDNRRFHCGVCSESFEWYSQWVSHRIQHNTSSPSQETVRPRHTGSSSEVERRPRQVNINSRDKQCNHQQQQLTTHPPLTTHLSTLNPRDRERLSGISSSYPVVKEAALVENQMKSPPVKQKRLEILARRNIYKQNKPMYKPRKRKIHRRGEIRQITVIEI